jgi:hypothetical protein
MQNIFYEQNFLAYKQQAILRTAINHPPPGSCYNRVSSNCKHEIKLWTHFSHASYLLIYLNLTIYKLNQVQQAASDHYSLNYLILVFLLLSLS